MMSLKQWSKVWICGAVITGVMLAQGAHAEDSEKATATKPVTKQGESLGTVKAYQDVRGKDLRKVDLSGDPNLPATLTFNLKTRWPSKDRLPAGFSAASIMQAGLNPGLGIRDLHRQGIVGRGVTVAIIDQPMYTHHPEFEGKILAYHDVGCGSKSSMKCYPPPSVGRPT